MQKPFDFIVAVGEVVISLANLPARDNANLFPHTYQLIVFSYAIFPRSRFHSDAD